MNLHSINNETCQTVGILFPSDSLFISEFYFSVSESRSRFIKLIIVGILVSPKNNRATGHSCMEGKGNLFLTTVPMAGDQIGKY